MSCVRSRDLLSKALAHTPCLRCARAISLDTKPHPNECVALIRELGATCVAGNHDLIVTGRLSDEGIGALARETLRWTAQALDGSTRAFLAGLPVAAQADGVLVTHGARSARRTPAASTLAFVAGDDGVDLAPRRRAACAGGLRRSTTPTRWRPSNEASVLRRREVERLWRRDRA